MDFIEQVHRLLCQSATVAFVANGGSEETIDAFLLLKPARGVVGEFFPRSHTATRKNELHFVPPFARNPQRVLLSVCHELGHFIAHYSALREETYLGGPGGRPPGAATRFHIWRKDIALDASNQLLNEIKDTHPDWPARLKQRRLELARAKPLAESDARAVITDERLAWLLGAQIAVRLGVEWSILAQEASEALSWYGEWLARPDLVPVLSAVDIQTGLGSLPPHVVQYLERLCA